MTRRFVGLVHRIANFAKQACRAIPVNLVILVNYVLICVSKTVIKACVTRHQDYAYIAEKDFILITVACVCAALIIVGIVILKLIVLNAILGTKEKRVMKCVQIASMVRNVNRTTDTVSSLVQMDIAEHYVTNFVIPNVEHAIV